MRRHFACGVPLPGHRRRNLFYLRHLLSWRSRLGQEMRVAVAGAEGHATVVADERPAGGGGEFVGFLGDDESLWGTPVAGYPGLWPVAARAAGGSSPIA